jgi:hypothetical protein
VDAQPSENNKANVMKNADTNLSCFMVFFFPNEKSIE